MWLPRSMASVDSQEFPFGNCSCILPLFILYLGPNSISKCSGFLFILSNVFLFLFYFSLVQSKVVRLVALHVFVTRVPLAVSLSLCLYFTVLLSVSFYLSLSLTLLLSLFYISFYLSLPLCFFHSSALLSSLSCLTLSFCLSPSSLPLSLAYSP